MVDSFTQAKVLQIETVKNSLTSDCRNYFFSPLKSVDEFKDITFSMFAMQKHYFYSALVKALESFKAFFQTAYYLLTANFPQAKSAAYKTLSSTLGCLTDVILAAASVCLGILRLTSLLISTVASTCASFFAYCVSNPERQKKYATLDDAIQSLKEFNRTYEQVMEEKSDISKTLDDYSEKASYRLAQHPNPRGLFSEDLRAAEIKYPNRQKRNELLSGLQELMDSYPE